MRRWEQSVDRQIQMTTGVPASAVSRPENPDSDVSRELLRPKRLRREAQGRNNQLLRICEKQSLQ